jgi:hypothetical protein
VAAVGRQQLLDTAELPEESKALNYPLLITVLAAKGIVPRTRQPRHATSGVAVGAVVDGDFDDLLLEVILDLVTIVIPQMVTNEAHKSQRERYGDY